jgi:hypothetical protein
VKSKEQSGSESSGAFGGILDLIDKAAGGTGTAG